MPRTGTAPTHSCCFPPPSSPALTTPASSNFSPYDPNVIFLDRSLLSLPSGQTPQRASHPPNAPPHWGSLRTPWLSPFSRP